MRDRPGGSTAARSGSPVAPREGATALEIDERALEDLLGGGDHPQGRRGARGVAPHPACLRFSSALEEELRRRAAAMRELHVRPRAPTLFTGVVVECERVKTARPRPHRARLRLPSAFVTRARVDPRQLEQQSGWLGRNSWPRAMAEVVDASHGGGDEPTSSFQASHVHLRDLSVGKDPIGAVGANRRAILQGD